VQTKKQRIKETVKRRVLDAEREKRKTESKRESIRCRASEGVEKSE
jgi:hypothetical protein